MSKHYNCFLRTEAGDRTMSKKSIYRIYTVALIVLCYGIIAQAQQITSVVQVSKDSVLIGDKIALTILIKYPKDVEIQGLDFSGYDMILNQKYALDTVNQEQYADISILDVGTWKGLSGDQMVGESKLNPVLKGDHYQIENTISIAIYNEGDFRIPNPKLLFDSPEDIVASASPMIRVFLPEQLQTDTLSINPIKDIMIEKANWTDYQWILYILVGLLVIGALIYWLKHRKHKPEDKVVIEEAIIIPAHEKALTALNALNKAELWQNGRIKEYQSGLTDIIRTYLEDRYQVKALEMTTDEISRALENTDFEPKYKADLREILQVADLVKFAKAIPTDNIHEVFMSKAVDFVGHTRETGAFSNHSNTSDHG